MGETTDEIVRHIETERAQLKGKVAELQTKVQDVTNVRKQFRRNPMLLPATVIGTSLFLSLIFRNR
jgi:hypothetical protein